MKLGRFHQNFSVSTLFLHNKVFSLENKNIWCFHRFLQDGSIIKLKVVLFNEQILFFPVKEECRNDDDKSEQASRLKLNK